MPYSGTKLKQTLLDRKKGEKLELCIFQELQKEWTGGVLYASDTECEFKLLQPWRSLPQKSLYNIIEKIWNSIGSKINCDIHIGDVIW